MIVKDLLFYGYEAFDDETGITLIPFPESPNARKMVIATHELLSPDDHSAASEIPWDTRKRILHLNPFIVDDDSILDEVEQEMRPIEDAVNPDLDPNRSNSTRAIKVMSLDLGKGAEINFYESNGVSINQAESHATSYTTTLSSATSVGLDIGIPVNVFQIGLGFGSSFFFRRNDFISNHF